MGLVSTGPPGTCPAAPGPSPPRSRGPGSAAVADRDGVQRSALDLSGRAAGLDAEEPEAPQRGPHVGNGRTTVPESEDLHTAVGSHRLTIVVPAVRTGPAGARQRTGPPVR